MRPHTITLDEFAEHVHDWDYASATTLRGTRKRLVVITHISPPSVSFDVRNDRESVYFGDSPEDAVHAYNDLG